MTIAAKDRSDRLDSWKAIADYLGRDVRTLLRWEKEKGLPVHRVPGGKRQAVFAFVQELDDWLVKSGDPSSEAGSRLEDHRLSEYQLRRPQATYGEREEAAGIHSESAHTPVFGQPAISETEPSVLTNRQSEPFGDKIDCESAKPTRQHRRPPWWRRKSTIAVAACIGLAAALYAWLAPRAERLRRMSELQQLKVVPLTALPGNVWSPTFSPDGNQIAFGWHDDTYAPGSNLYAKVIGTAEPLQLTHDPPGVDVGGAAWSPDGKAIALCRGSGIEDHALYLVSALGGPLRKITSTTCQTYKGSTLRGNPLSWSPDGRQLVFPHRHANSPSDWTVRLFVLSLDSMAEVPVKSDCNNMTSPAFSPRGDYLAWACIQKMSDNSIYVQRLSDGSVTQLLQGFEGFGGLAWSGDGRHIVFSTGSSDTGGDLWEVALARPNRPERLPFGHDAVDLAVSYASHRLAFQQVHINVNIWRVDLTQPQAPAQKIVVSSRKQNSPNYSPDGKQIAFDSDRSGHYETWVSDADGSNPMQLTSFGIKLSGTPRWSPDGKVIALDSRAEGEANIYLVDPRGGVPRKLDIDIRDNTMPTWSHDGAWIYFTSGYDDKANTSVWKVPYQGGHAVRISQGYAYVPQESPDGQYVYFSRNWWLWRVRTDGTDEQQVEGMPRLRGLEAWTPFGGGIYFLGSANGKSAINFFDLKTKEVRPIYYLQKPAPIWLGGLPISNDGKWLLLPLLEDASSDLMMVENWR